MSLSIVSIHATLAGGDKGNPQQEGRSICFYPRHPRGWRQQVAGQSVQVARCFYPRHPRGWRPRAVGGYGFQHRVSIHATLAGGDGNSGYIQCNMCVSIHATLAGGDVCSGKAVARHPRFYPRHPRGWRPPGKQWNRHRQDVSIHATHAGGDGRSRFLLALRGCFYPRHPRGWRPTSSIACDKRLMFLSTPPSRVATVEELAESKKRSAFLSTPPSRVATLR